MDPFLDVAQQYLNFAVAARDESPCFADWASGVAGDQDVLTLLGTLPTVKRQPNLVFAAARWVGVPAPSPYAAFRGGLLGSWPAIRTTILERSTQTNEVGRLATLVPAFAQLERQSDRPLALLEVGASAGLCLYPDRYGYAWTTEDGIVSTRPDVGQDGPTLECTVSGPAPLPARPPVVAWRGGVDLNPLDVYDEDAMAWLENLVWPEQQERRVRLHHAVEIARRGPPVLLRGDLFSGLPELMRRVPADTTLVVFHSAVIVYLDPPSRARFARLMTRLVSEGSCHWVSNEAPRVLPVVSGTALSDHFDPSLFVLGIDGQAVARTHGHGAAMTWLTAGGGIPGPATLTASTVRAEEEQ